MARGRKSTSVGSSGRNDFVLRVRTADGFQQFRRCGRLFTSEVAEIAAADLSDDEVARLMDTAALVVEVIQQAHKQADGDVQ